MKAEFKCLKCGYEYKDEPGPTVCRRCGHLYVKWLNYNEMERLLFSKERKERIK